MVARLSCLLCALAALVLAGCSTPNLLSFISVAVTDVKPAANPGEIAVTIRFGNGNVVPVGASRTEHKLYLDGDLVAKCNSNDPVGLKPQGVVSQTLLFKVTNPALLEKLSRLGVPANYRLQSELNVYVDEDRLVVKSSHSGAIDLSALAAKR